MPVTGCTAPSADTTFSLTNPEFVNDSYVMTSIARTLTSPEAHGVAGMMMPRRAVMCCRMHTS